MSVEISGGVNAHNVNGGIDSSNLHLRKELTQIRKAARVLRDPGTSSTWRSPINSARSLTKHQHHHKNGEIDGNNASEQFLNSNHTTGNRNGNDTSFNTKGNGKEKERNVFLYNWSRQKSESERSKQIGEDDVEKDEGSYTTHDSSVDLDSSLSDARNNGGNDSKSDTYTNNRYSSAIFKCKGADFAPSIRRAIKKKPKRSSYYYASTSLKHHNEKLQNQIIMSRKKKHVVGERPISGLDSDDLASSFEQSDGMEDYCNSEVLRRVSTVSPIVAKLRNHGWTGSPPTRLLRSLKKEDGSLSYSTPALSTSSYRKHGIRNPSVVGSWDATTGSLNEADDEVDDHIDFTGRSGCGISCYWSRKSTPKSRISCSPSLSDTLRRKGSSILCGTQSMRRRRDHRSSNKRGLMNSRAISQGLVPLLTNSSDGLEDSSMGSQQHSDDDEITNLGEIDLEALSRLDGRRWSTSVRSQEGSELVALNSEAHDESSPENMRSLSHKYRPMFFDELIGQNIVVQSLKSAVSRKRIAPVYLFQGPRGTGKTSMARIFAAALNCLASEATNKPCGICRACADFLSGNSMCIKELDGSNKKGIEKIIWKSVSLVHPSPDFPQFKVFVVNECHLLPSKTWLTFLRLLEKHMSHVVFILETSDSDNMPRAVLSRCQKHAFNKICNGDIVSRLKRISSEEDLDVDTEALELIASNADGSLRDAETMIDQLSLFGKRITVSLVNELIGVVSDEKLLDLLELAMSSNASETVVKAKELIESGVDPIVLMSQMATLIVDIIAGTHDAKHDSFFGGRNLSERELDRLKHALNLLSEAEKHLRNSSDRSTWFKVTLLQLGSMPSPDRTHSGSSRRQSSKTTEDDRIYTAHKTRRDVLLGNDESASPKSSFSKAGHHSSTSNDKHFSPTQASGFKYNLSHGQLVNDGVLTFLHDDDEEGITSSGRCMDSKMLSDVWLQCIEKCHSRTLREILHSYGRLVAISAIKGGFVAYIAFEDQNIKNRAEGFLSSITNSFEIVLRRNIEVKLLTLHKSSCQKLINHKPTHSYSSAGNADSIDVNSNTRNTESTKPEIPVQRIESIIREQRLETAWLQAMEMGTPGSMSCSRPERNQVLPQDSTFDRNSLKEKTKSADLTMQHFEDELNIEIKALKINDAREKNNVAKRGDHHYPVSPSLLHTNSFASNYNKDNMGYESGPGTARCSGMFCWNTTRNQRRPKAKPGMPLRPRKSGPFLWFGECARSRRSGNRHNG